MASIKVGKEAFGNSLIPVGLKLRMSVFDFEVGQVGSGPHQGEDRLQVTAKVTEDGEYKGKEIRYNNIPLYSDSKTDWVLAAFADAMGWKVDKDNGEIDLPDSFQSILGTEFVGKVGQRTNAQNGNVYNQVNGYAPLGKGGGGGQPAPKKASWDQV
jgi:hypothetical protein